MIKRLSYLYYSVVWSCRWSCASLLEGQHWWLDGTGYIRTCLQLISFISCMFTSFHLQTFWIFLMCSKLHRRSATYWSTFVERKPNSCNAPVLSMVQATFSQEIAHGRRWTCSTIPSILTRARGCFQSLISGQKECWRHYTQWVMEQFSYRLHFKETIPRVRASWDELFTLTGWSQRHPWAVGLLDAWRMNEVPGRRLLL